MNDGYDAHRIQGPPLFKLCSSTARFGVPSYGHTVTIGHGGCAQVELGHTEICMDAIRVEYSESFGKKGRREEGDRQRNIEYSTFCAHIVWIVFVVGVQETIIVFGV